MSATLKIALTPEAQAVLHGFQTLPARMLEKMKAALDESDELVLGKVSAAHFTGRGPFPVGEHRLGVRTGRLRTSLRSSKAIAISTGGGLQQVSATIGSNVEYLGVHEHGFKGTVSVRAFTRRNPRGDVRARFSRVSPKTSLQTFTRRKIASGISNVRASKRNMNIPARAPLSTGIKENLDIYREKLSAAVLEAIKE